MAETVFTLKEYNCLLAMRKKPRTWNELRQIANVPTDEDMNIMLSRMEKLYYAVDDEPKTKGKLKLNQIGETVAQAEYDRRFDMYYTRFMSAAALLISIIAVIVSIFAG